MSHPRIEEISESDMSDPSEGDIDDFADSDILRQRALAPESSSSSSKPAAAPSQPQFFNPANNPLFPGTNPGGPISANDIAGYQCLYPIYFDASRTRAEGRRVPANLAAQNPLAREIANACVSLRVAPVFEAHKIHPQDWANPGRVRVNLKDPKNPYLKQIKNKHHFYILVAKYLKEHPTTEQSDALRRVKIPGLPGMPQDIEPWPKPAVPRGWKMNELVPAYSAAMTGGGVSENALRDMMKDMGGAGGPGTDMMSMLQGMGGMPGMPGPSGSQGAAANEGASKKKDKKGKGK